jgi:hypothetical protein
MPHGFLTDLPFTDLWTDTWVVIAPTTTRPSPRA